MNAVTIPTPLSRLIDKVQRCYPYGIPKHLLARNRAAEEPAAVVGVRPRNVLFLIAATLSELTSEEVQLLASIVTKGLLLSEESTRHKVCVLTEHSDLGKWAADEMRQAHGVDTVIAMGLNIAPHGSVVDNGMVTLHTVSLSEVLVSKDAKRLFWGHLQQLLRSREGTA